MANWCWNSLILTTETPQQFEQVIQGIAGDSKQPFDFDRLIPEPKELLEVESPNIKNPDEMRRRYGHSCWYEWRVAKWGTRGNAGDCDLTIESPTCLRITFTTAWNPPMPIIEFLSQKFLFLHIEYSYEGDEGYWGKVWFDKGELLENQEGDIDCEYRIENWGDCSPDCESCGVCDCECGCDSRTTQTICALCNNNEHENKNNLPEFSKQKIGVA